MDKISTTRRGADSPLSWLGDNLGQQAGSQVTIVLQDENGEHINASVAATLILANRINLDERRRILSALRHYAEAGELHPADLQAYTAWEEEQSASWRENPSFAVREINKVTCLLNTLRWAATKCEDAHDYEQFQALSLMLVPHLGMTLERAVSDHLGTPGTGLFGEEKETSHA